MDKLDLQIECLFESTLFEHRGKPSKQSINHKYDNKAAKINRKYNGKLAKAKALQSMSMSDNLRMKNKNYQYHRDMANSTTGLSKAYHKLKKFTNGIGSTSKKIDKIQSKRNKKLEKNQRKRNKKLNESILLYY